MKQRAAYRLGGARTMPCLLMIHNPYFTPPAQDTASHEAAAALWQYPAQINSPYLLRKNV